MVLVYLLGSLFLSIR